MKRSLAFASLLLAMSCSSQAQVIGHGIGVHDSCGSFVAALKNHGPGTMWRNPDGELLSTMAHTYINWVQGFITATNLGRPDNGQIMTDQQGLSGWLKNYCEKHPEQTLNMATIELVRAIPPGFQ